MTFSLFVLRARDNEVRHKQKAVIEFLSREDLQPKTIFNRLQSVYGAQTLDISTVR